MGDQIGGLPDGKASNAREVPGVFSKAIQVSGNNSWLSLGSVISSCYFPMVGCSGFGVAFWVRLEDSLVSFPKKLLGNHDINEKVMGFLLWLKGPESIGIQFNDARTQCISSVNLTRQIWTHFAFVPRAWGITIFKNAELLTDNSECSVSNSISSGTDLMTGHVTAAFDDLMIWNRRINNPEVRKAYKYHWGMYESSTGTPSVTSRLFAVVKRNLLSHCVVYEIRQVRGIDLRLSNQKVFCCELVQFRC